MQHTNQKPARVSRYHSMAQHAVNAGRGVLMGGADIIPVSPAERWL